MGSSPEALVKVELWALLQAHAEPGQWPSAWRLADATSEHLTPRTLAADLGRARTQLVEVVEFMSVGA